MVTETRRLRQYASKSVQWYSLLEEVMLNLAEALVS